MDSIIKWNGHTHTPFCHHGSDAPLREYLDNAVAEGFTRYSVTEHPPLPAGWLKNSSVQRLLAMDWAQVDDYFQTVSSLKKDYRGKLDVKVGLELDYLPGKEAFTLNLVDEFRNEIEDAIVSVHFLPGSDGMRCVDLSAEDFQSGLLAHYGSMDAVVRTYFDAVREAIQFAAGLRMPKRIGHLLLIQKFRQALPPVDDGLIDEQLAQLLPLLQSAGVGVDVNTAGFRQSQCDRSYVPEWFVAECLRKGIPCVFGSDAHAPSAVSSGWDWYERILRELA